MNRFEIETAGIKHIENYKKWNLKQLKAYKFEEICFYDRNDAYTIMNLL